MVVILSNGNKSTGQWLINQFILFMKRKILLGAVAIFKYFR
jgi:hypothetical protein